MSDKNLTKLKVKAKIEFEVEIAHPEIPHDKDLLIHVPSGMPFVFRAIARELSEHSVVRNTGVSGEAKEWWMATRHDFTVKDFEITKVK